MSFRSFAPFAAAVLLASSATAAPIAVSFKLDSATGAGGPYPFITRLQGGDFPIVGNGSLEFDASGNLLGGTLTLPTATLEVDMLPDSTPFGSGEIDAYLTMGGWTQNLAPASKVSGVSQLAGGTASGVIACTLGPGMGGALFCSSVPKTVSPFGVNPLGSETAGLRLLTWTDASHFSGAIAALDMLPAACGAATSFCGNGTWSYSFATVTPEPQIAALLGAGLGLTLIRRRRR